MAQQLRFILDGADRGQPLNPDDFGFTINEDSDLNFRVVSFNNDLTFGGETYDYLFTELVDNGGCQLVQVSVQYKCDSAWKPLVNGWLIISECVFDLDKCQVKTRLYDESFSTKINNNKSIPFSMASIYTKNLEIVPTPTVYDTAFFNPPTGVYDYVEQIGCVTVYDAFKHLITCMSDGLVDFESTLFKMVFPSEDNGFQTRCIFLTNGYAIFDRKSYATTITFEQLYVALNKKLRLGMAFERQANGRPLLRIEEAEYFFGLIPSANLYDQPSIDLQFDTTQIFASINFGCSPYLEQFECNGGETACTFFQNSFLGFKDETFGMIGKCNTAAVLNLKSDDVVFDTNVIEEIYRFNSQTYNDNPIIVDCLVNGDGIVINQVIARKGDPYGIGQTVYNAAFTNEQSAANWIGGYPNSIYSFTQGFLPGSTQFEAQSNADPLQDWDVLDEFTSYRDLTGQFVRFDNEIIDVSNNFNGQTYTVPYTGTYTFSAQFLLGVYTGEELSREAYASIRRYDADELLLNYFNGDVVVDVVDEELIVNVTWVVVCNEGDRVRADVWAKTDGVVPGGQMVTIDNTYDGEFTYFEGIGVPFPNQLQPVDPNSVRRLIYKFERPLTMEEVVSILNNTSSPIKFGKWNDPLRVIPGYIKTVNVQSVIKQNANFELKSNQILR